MSALEPALSAEKVTLTTAELDAYGTYEDGPRHLRAVGGRGTDCRPRCGGRDEGSELPCCVQRQDRGLRSGNAAGIRVA